MYENIAECIQSIAAFSADLRFCIEPDVGEILWKNVQIEKSPPGDFFKFRKMFIMHILTPQKFEKWFQMFIHMSNRWFATIFVC